MKSKLPTVNREFVRNFSLFGMLGMQVGLKYCSVSFEDGKIPTKTVKALFRRDQLNETEIQWC